MDRERVATALGVVAALAVVATSVVAVLRLSGDEEPRAATGSGRPEPSARLVVQDPRSSATFEVPAEGWRVEGRHVRIYYTDEAGDPSAVVRGPAVYDEGYCRARPRGSNRGFAGFTREPFRAWVRGLTRGRGTRTTGVDRRGVTLADGSSGSLTRLGLRLDRSGPCSAGGVEVAMVQAAGVRVVLVRDTGADEALPDEAVERILTSLRVS